MEGTKFCFNIWLRVCFWSFYIKKWDLMAPWTLFATCMQQDAWSVDTVAAEAFTEELEWKIAELSFCSSGVIMLQSDKVSIS